MAVSTEVAPRHAADIEAPITNGEIDTLYRLANALSQSRFFRDAHQAQQAFAKLLFGRDMGLSATQAMTDIHIVEGKPEMSANLHASRVLSSGKYDYTVLVLDDRECSIEFTRTTDDKRLGVSTFTIEDAQRARLVGRGADNYTKYSRNMLFARAMTNGVAWFCPDVFNGIRVYAEGEVQATLASQPQARPEPEAAPTNAAMTDALAKGVNLAGWDDDRLAMELVALGVEDVSDPLGALASLTAQQGEQLNQTLSAEVDAPGDQEGAGDGDD